MCRWGRVDRRVCVVERRCFAMRGWIVAVVGEGGLTSGVVRILVYRSLSEALWSFSICLPLSLAADTASSTIVSNPVYGNLR